MKQENKKQLEEDCPFCEISEEAIEKLKTSKDFKKENKKFKWPWKWWIALLALGVVIGSLAAYQLLNNSSEIDNSSQNQLAKVVSQESKNENKNDSLASLTPDFTSEDVFGNKITLSDFRNEKPVLLVFWATWCGYCKQELPDLKTFHQKYKDSIEVVVIDSGESKEIIKDYIQENNIDFLVLLDEQRGIWNQYLVRGTPSHFLINKKGEAVTAWPGLASINDLEKMFQLLK